MRRLAMVLAVLAGVIPLDACVSTRSRGTTPRTMLEVDNQGFADMTIYVVNSGQRIRLGLATGKSTTSLRIPASVIGSGRELSFVADPVGSNRAAVSEQLYVRAGETVTLTIPP